MAGAGNAIIGALRITLGADTAAFEAGLKSASSSLAAFGAGAGKALAAAGAAMSVAAIGLGVAVKHSIDEADKLGKMSQKFGVPVEELSALKYAASLADVSFEALGKGLGKLSKAMVEAAAKPMSEAANAFRALGISATNSDGTLKSSSEVMTEVAGKFEGLKDGVGKTAVSMALFGKAGAELIPLLNGGKKGLEDLKAEAERFGVVIGPETTKHAEEFNDNLKRLDAIWHGLVLKLTEEMLPGLKNLSASMVMVAGDSNLIKGAADLLIGSFQGFVNVLLTSSLALTRFGAEWDAFREFMKTDIFSGDIIKNYEKWAAVGAESTRQHKALADSLESMRLVASGAFGEVTTKTDAAAKSQKDFNYAAMGGKNAIDNFTDSLKKKIEVMKAEAGSIGQSNLQTEKAKIIAEGMAIATANKIKLAPAEKASLDALAASTALWNEKAAFAKQIYEQTRTPAEQFTATIERLNVAFDGGKRFPETYARAVAQAQDKLTQANPAAQILGSSLETAFGRAMEKGAQLGEVLRSLLRDLAKAAASAMFRQLLFGNAGAGGTSVGILGTIFGGARAGGGPVSAGMSYMVGERGPEMFVPDSPGQMISNRDLGGGMGGGFVFAPSYHFDAGIGPSDMTLIQAQIAASEQRTRADVTNIVAGDLSRNREALGVPL